MNLDKLNQWLVLVANLGVLLGIIAVVLELRQTQTTMSAEASSVRAQMALDIGEIRYEYEIHIITQKLQNGQELTFDEEVRLQRSEENMLRYFENLHYQNEIGVLDEEIWNANFNNITNWCSIASFRHVFPNWPNELEAGRYRASFVQLLADGCN